MMTNKSKTFSELLPELIKIKDDLSFKTHPQDYEAQNILLTGATGFLGAYILYNLIKVTKAQIYCLVRPKKKSASTVLGRVKENLNKYNLWSDVIETRITVVEGYVTESKFGLDDSTYNSLSDKIDMIYHNAASVDLVASFEDLLPSNVFSTQYVLEFAEICTLKAFYYVSTIGVYMSNMINFDNAIDLHNTPELLPVPYTQTKWVCETKLKKAQKKGLPLKIFRPGAVLGSASIGVCELKELFPCRFIKGLVQLGYVPLADFYFPYIPVDLVADVIVSLSLNETSIDTFNIAPLNPLTEEGLYDIMRNHGYKFESIPYDEWIKKIKDLPFRNALRPEKNTILDETLKAPFFSLMFRNVVERISVHKTVEELKPYNMTLEVDHQAVFASNIKYFKREKFL